MEINGIRVKFRKAAHIQLGWKLSLLQNCWISLSNDTWDFLSLQLTGHQELLLVSKSEAFESLKLGTITGHEAKAAFKKLELLGKKKGVRVKFWNVRIFQIMDCLWIGRYELQQ